MRSTFAPLAADLRVRRGTRALVAQYIHELSARHAADREAAAPPSPSSSSELEIKRRT
jgi:hypothetical protein